ncbi:hypothetical protein, partial [Microcystis aeruginosa]
MILDKFLNLQGTCIQGYRHLENIGIVFQIESKNKKAAARLSVRLSVRLSSRRSLTPKSHAEVSRRSLTPKSHAEVSPNAYLEGNGCELGKS